MPCLFAHVVCVIYLNCIYQVKVEREREWKINKKWNTHGFIRGCSKQNNNRRVMLKWKKKYRKNCNLILHHSSTLWDRHTPYSTHIAANNTEYSIIVKYNVDILLKQQESHVIHVHNELIRIFFAWHPC